MTAINNIADVRRAIEGLSGELAERAHEMDRVRRMPADLAQKMASTGIFRIVTPKSLGGYEATAREVVELLEQIAVSMMRWVLSDKLETVSAFREPAGLKRREAPAIREERRLVSV